MKSLKTRLEVRWEELAAARLRSRVGSLRTRIQRDLLFRAMYGLQRAVSQFLSEKYLQWGHRPALPAQVADQLRAQLLPGDVLITRKEFASDELLPAGVLAPRGLVRRPGIGHGTVAAGGRVQLSVLAIRLPGVRPREEGRVLEALKDGVQLRSITTPLTCDAIALLRPRLSRPEIRSGLARGFRFVGRPYDFDFDFSRSDRMVCTEVVYRSYEGLGGLQFSLVRRAGRLTLAAEDLMRMALGHHGFEIVGAFAPRFTTQCLWAAEAERVLQETLCESHCLNPS